jgi:hypothetical protein
MNMFTEKVREIIIQAVNDPEMREALFSDVEKAFAGQALSQEEVQILKDLKREDFDLALTELEDRISRAGVSSQSVMDILSTPFKTAGPNVGDNIGLGYRFFRALGGASISDPTGDDQGPG